jgi:hypothetical protein
MEKEQPGSSGSHFYIKPYPIHCRFKDWIGYQRKPKRKVRSDTKSNPTDATTQIATAKINPTDVTQVAAAK